MNDGLTVVTLTGDRPIPFGLCQTWLARQTRRPDQWIVVDDGHAPLNWTGEGPRADYVRREPTRDDPPHTLALNMLAAIPAIRFDKVAFIEDDDWYAPDYLAWIESEFRDGRELIGQGGSIYYRLIRREYRRMDNDRHASLCATACRGAEPLKTLRQLCRSARDPFIDIRWWGYFAGRKAVLPPEPAYHLGIKELPGRPGTSSGWRPDSDGYTSDRDGSVLRSLIGADADLYAPYVPLVNAAQLVEVV